MAETPNSDHESGDVADFLARNGTGEWGGRRWADREPETHAYGLGPEPERKEHDGFPF